MDILVPHNSSNMDITDRSVFELLPNNNKTVHPFQISNCSLKMIRFCPVAMRTCFDVNSGETDETERSW